MKTKASLSLLIGAWLLMAAANVPAHDGPHRDHWSRGYYDLHYDYRARPRHAMPRWLKRNRSFRHWYRNNHYRYDRRLAWDSLWEIYRVERRYYRYHAYGFEHRDHRRRGKGFHRHWRH